MDTICGIYMIRNVINDKKYIGKSFDINKRWSNHKYKLNKGAHVNNHLQNAWNKYGKDNFEFSIIELCNEDDLNDREIYWIKVTDAYYNGYNQTEGGEGTHLPEEVKAKIGAAAKEWWANPENKNRMSEARKGEGSFWYGKMFSKDMIQKLSEAHKNPSEEVRQKQSRARQGKQLTEETRRKISESSKGKIVSEDTKLKMSKSKVGENNSRSRAVYCIELDEYFWGAAEAYNKYGINVNGICSCCRGRKQSAGKHPITGEKLHWVYADEWQVAS